MNRDTEEGRGRLRGRDGRWGLWGGYGTVALCLTAVALGRLSTDRVALLAGVWVVAGLGWLWAMRSARGRRGTGFPWAIALGALGLRLLALAASPELSDDPNRYVWEGALVLAGKSPYAHAPDAPELAPERSAWSTIYAGVNHPEVSAAYPPLTQAFCAAVVGLAGGADADAGQRALFLLRVAFTLCDLLLLLPLVRCLRLCGRPTELACVWAWSPLVALEFAGAGHFDALGILCLVSALASRRAVRGGALLACGTLVKLLPMLALPFALRIWRPRARALWSFALVLGIGVVSPLLLQDGELGLSGGLSQYALRWESFHLIYGFVERPLAAFFEPDGSWTDPRRLGRLVVGAAFAACAALAWCRQSGMRADPARESAPAAPDAGLFAAVFFVLASFLVLTPTLHPWYLTWVVPFLAFRPSRAWSWLVLSAPLLYWPLEGWRAEGIWHEPVWLWPVVALPFWALLLFRSPDPRPLPTQSA